MEHSEMIFRWPAKFGTLMNLDSDSVYYFAEAMGWNFDNAAAKLHNYFKRYIGSGITDLIWDVDGIVPRKDPDGEWKGNRYQRREENGIAVDYAGKHDTTEAIYRLYFEEGVNPVAIWLRECWENRIRPWVSFRMNDVHCANAPTGHSDFFYLAKRKGWMVGNYHDGNRWYGYALDYSVPEVREHFLSYIAEVTELYDAFGIELDFQRTLRCFRDLDSKNCKVMTEFLRQVDAIRKKAETIWGHPWRVMVRLCERPEWAKLYGFDVEAWVRGNLADAIVPSGYWGSTDSAIPIGEWRALCGGGIPVFWGIEAHTVNMLHLTNADAVSAYYLSAKASGADGLYQFNLFGAPWAWGLCSEDAAYAIPTRRFLTAMNDVQVPGWYEYVPHYLPLSVRPGTAVCHSVTTGKLKTGEDIILHIGVLADEDGKTPADAAEALNVKLNGVPCEYLGVTGESFLEKHYPDTYREQERDRYPWRIFSWRIRETNRQRLTGERVTAVFSAAIPLQIDYFELANGEFNEQDGKRR